jgi:uncharacterized protein (TIGR03067 family)
VPFYVKEIFKNRDDLKKELQTIFSEKDFSKDKLRIKMVAPLLKLEERLKKKAPRRELWLGKDHRMVLAEIERGERTFRLVFAVRIQEGKAKVVGVIDDPAFVDVADDGPRTLEGKWAGKGNGTRITLSFDKGSFVLTFQDNPTAFAKGTFKGTYKLNTSVQPHHLDLNVTEAPDDKYKGKTALAICEFFGGQGLVLCAGEPGRDTRPKRFTAEGEQLHAEFGRAK